MTWDALGMTWDALGMTWDALGMTQLCKVSKGEMNGRGAGI